MGDFFSIIQSVWDCFKLDFTLYGFTFSFADVFFFGIAFTVITSVIFIYVRS